MRSSVTNAQLRTPNLVKRVLHDNPTRDFRVFQWCRCIRRCVFEFISQKVIDVCYDDDDGDGDGGDGDNDDNDDSSVVMVVMVIVVVTTMVMVVIMIIAVW